MLEYSSAATSSLASCCPKTVFLAGRSGWTLVALSPSQSRAGQRDGVATSSPGPSLFSLGSLPRGKKGCGQEQSLASPSLGLLWGGSPMLQPPCCGFREGCQAESTAGRRSRPPRSGERDGGPCRYSSGMERG